ncbi:MAG: Nramp family divalent metal transporter [Burkholderiales bacterium]|nr:Nramp family divalent metal transporter [Burkholderiales bacterium]MDE2456707.1 Nramp family divalent metal transporter [Burkholderiales bacterium]
MTNLEQTVDMRLGAPQRWRALGFVGPATMVSVGYMDPGNWATDLEGGARFGYQLLWVLLASNLMAMLLQSLAARLGIVGRVDLAQACRRHYARPVVWALWGLSEIAIIACDLAEVVGSAIALNLLFRIPLAWGAVITGLDVMLILVLQHYGIRKLEAVVAALVFTIGACMGIEILLAQPDWGQVAGGLVPQLDRRSLFVAIGIIGATVMPHNLYLHSSLVQTRRIDTSTRGLREAIRYNFIDTALALNIAFVINAAILVLSASTFFTRGIVVTDLAQAHELLTPLLGTTLAASAFAIALLASGQSSTITGTLAGQVVMEGFVRLRLSPIKRRLITRAIAVVPAVAVLAHAGSGGVLQLLVWSQVVLSLQLPFAIVPLVRFTSERRIMGRFANPGWQRRLAWQSGALILALNVWLVVQELPSALTGAGAWLAGLVAVSCAFLLVWIAWVPLRRMGSER